MLLNLFYLLRGLGVGVSATEWLTLMRGLDKGLHNDCLEDFYYLSRSLLIKDVAHYDAFDQAFQHLFSDGAVPDNLATKEDILSWLADGRAPYILSQDELDRMERLTLDELLRELEDRLRTQDGVHNGGSNWIGTGGTSPFGMNGSHPTGISFAPEGGGGRAMVQAFGRKYKNLRNDITLDIRQMTVALKRLRDLRQTGSEEVLDLDATIDKTCRDGGEIDLVFGRERENTVRLILAMDTGGSMEPYRRLSEQLFSAADGLNHFKEFTPYYFHNCIYDNLYEDIETEKFELVDDVIKNRSINHRLVIVGDASMAPYELMIPNGILENRRTSNVKGIDRLRALAMAFPKRAWLNPMREDSWDYYDTVARVGGLFPMYPLTVSGLARAVKALL